MGENFSTEPLLGSIKHETNDILFLKRELQNVLIFEAFEQFRNIVLVKRKISIFRHYEGQDAIARVMEVNQAVDEEGEHELRPLVIAAIQYAPLIIPPPPELIGFEDENAILDPDTDIS